MMKPFYSADGIYLAVGEDAIQITFEQRGVEIYLAPGVANGFGHAMQAAACSVGVHPIGGKKDYPRMIRELEALYEKYKESEP